MKITKVEIMEFVCDTNINFRPIGCRVYTDEGIYGDGEAALSYGVAASAAFGMVRDYATLIIGKDPLETEVIWDTIYKTTYWGQNGGPVIFAGLSALDVALWDIKGKFFNVPIYKLLGGKQRSDLRCYASQLQQGFGPVHVRKVTPEDYAEISKYVVSEGYDAIKIDFLTYDENGEFFDLKKRSGLLKPHTLALFESRLAAVREAVGSNVDIIIENHGHIDMLAAIQIGQMAEKYNILFFEEPNTPTAKTTKYIAENIRIPIASGERIYTRWQYAPYFENMCLRIAQPDIGTCGGITEAKKICDMAYVYDVAIQAHACGTPISSTVALHLETAVPNFIIHEHHLCFLHQYNIDLCINDYQPVRGRIAVPEIPGLGNEWSEKAMREAIKVVVE